MTVQFQALGRSLVLVLDRSLLAEHQVEPGTQFRLEMTPGALLMHRLPEPSCAEPEWSFETAQAWIFAKYAPAFRVLAR